VKSIKVFMQRVLSVAEGSRDDAALMQVREHACPPFEQLRSVRAWHFGGDLSQQFSTSRSASGLDQHEQSGSRGIDLQEADLTGRIAMDHDEGGDRRRLDRLELPGNPVHRPAVGQRPGKRRENGSTFEQIAGRVDAGHRVLDVGDRQGEFDPLVVGQLGQERRFPGGLLARRSQPLDELARQLEKIRRMRLVPGIEAANQAAPGLLASRSRTLLKNNSR
jgi:hypothetical protein